MPVEIESENFRKNWLDVIIEIESENFQDNWLDVISYQIVLSIEDGLACYYFRMDLPFTRAQKCM